MWEISANPGTGCYPAKPWLATALSGPAAGTIAAFTSQPFDTIKMYQQFFITGKKISIKQAAKEIIKKHGYKGFFTGASPRIARIISGVTIISNANEKITTYFNRFKK